MRRELYVDRGGLDVKQCTRSEKSKLQQLVSRHTCPSHEAAHWVFPVVIPLNEVPTLLKQFRQSELEKLPTKHHSLRSGFTLAYKAQLFASVSPLIPSSTKLPSTLHELRHPDTHPYSDASHQAYTDSSLLEDSNSGPSA